MTTRAPQLFNRPFTLRLEISVLCVVAVSVAAFSFGCDDASSDMYSGEYNAPYYDTSSSPSDPYYSADTTGGTYEDTASSPDATPDGDKYEPVGTNPFTMTAFDPLSTFAADVDTASYQIFKRDIAWGALPQPASVRLEEYVNYFPYGYAAPAHDSTVPFAISLEAAPTPFDAPTTLLRVGIKGKDVPPEEKRAANLVFLIDVSGSMQSAEKLPLVKTVLLETLEVLDIEDTVSLVTYASGTGVVLAPTPLTNKPAIVAAINGLSAGGSTNGAGGIQLAYQQAEAAFIEGGVNHVLLCTDGDFNVGVSGTDALVTLIEEKRQTGITLTVLGFGMGNLNDDMMESVSNAGNGIYGVINSADEAIDYVHHRMLSSIHFIAKDMKIQVEFNPAKVVAYRLLGYENRAIADQDFTNDRVDAGEIGAGHTVTALYELVLTGGEVPAVEGAPAVEDGPGFDGVLEVSADDLVLVKVRYKDVDATEADAAFQVDSALASADIVATVQDGSGDLQWAIAIAAFAELLKGSPYAAIDNLDMIKVLIDANAGTDQYRTEFVSLFGLAEALLR